MQDIHLHIHLFRDAAGDETETDSVSLAVVADILLKSMAWYFLHARMWKLSIHCEPMTSTILGEMARQHHDDSV